MRRKIIMFRRTVLAAMAAFLAVPTLAAPLDITDALGRKVTINTPVNRVIATFNYEEFTAVAGVEGWKKVVAISREPWAGWRPAIFARYAKVIPNLQDMPDVGHLEDSTFSAEKVIAARPDVLLMAEWGFTSARAQVQQIEAAGIPIVVIDYNAQVLARHLASTRALGKVMGAEARAEELATLYETRYADVLARVARARTTVKKKVYVELGQAGMETTGNTYNNTMWGRIITTLGAENIASGKIPGAWGPLNAESVLAEDPDLILIAGSSWLSKPKAVRTGYDTDPATTRASLAPYANRPGWSDLKAVRSGNINAIEHGLCRTLFDFVAMQYIGKRLYPEVFADVDPEKSFRDYHAKYLPVAYSGTWFLPLTP
jgi:iron complex transport system substrate-binding protein